MAYTAPHNVLQVYGSIVSEAEPEIWTTSLRFGEGNTLMGEAFVGAPDADVNMILDAISGDLGTWWNAISTRVGQGVTLEGFKFNAVDVLGHYISQTRTFQRDLAVPLTSTGGNMLPAQCSIAVTFRTNAARGLASTGRMYLPPPPSSTLAPGGRVADAVCEELAIATAQLLTNLSNWNGLDAAYDFGRVCVMSKVREGATRRVNACDVGDLYDTMRSRRNSLREHRSPASIVTS